MKNHPLVAVASAAVPLAAVALLALSSGCRTFQPASRQGHDLLDNPGRSAAIRVPAGIGAILGHAVALPVSVLLFPTLFFDGATVESCDVLVDRAPAPARNGRNGGGRQGDIYLPLVEASLEYGSGLGAAAIGQPFEWIACCFRDAPGPPPGYVEEAPELPPGVSDPRMSFAVNPPRRTPKPAEPGSAEPKPVPAEPKPVPAEPKPVPAEPKLVPAAPPKTSSKQAP